MPIIKCPGCAALLDAPAAVCPKCKLTLRQLDTKFGTIPLHSRYLTDRASSLTMEEVTRLRDLLQRFESRFPQSLFSVFLTDLPAGSSIREFAFWLANRAHFSSTEAAGAENFDLLLVIEPASGSAALTVGYGLESYVSEGDLKRTLAAAQPDLHGGELERAIRICIEEMSQRLCDTCKAVAEGSKGGKRVTSEEW